MINVKKFLPSKTFLLGILGVTVGIVTVLVLLRVIDQNGLFQSGTGKIFDELAPQSLTDVIVAQSVETLDQIQDIDSDKDGVKDWEEGLWQTDYQNPDTDGDGISDGEEVRIRRQAITDYNKEQGVLNPDGSLPDEELNQTDLFARDLYTTVTLLAQQGVLADNSQQVEDTVVQQVATMQLYDPLVFGSLDLVPTSQESVKNYIIDIGGLIKKYPLDADKISILFNQVLGNNDGSFDTSIVANYVNFAEEVETMKVPTELQSQHTLLVNALRHFNATLAGIIAADQEPIVGLASVLQFDIAVEEIINSYKNLTQLWK